MSEDRKQRIRMARIEAETMADRVVAMMLSSDRDAGWNGVHTLGKFHELQGFRPDGSGIKGVSRVWEQTGLLRDWPERYHLARAQMAKLKSSHREAVLIDRICRGRFRRVDQGGLVHWTDEEIAQALGMTEANFRQRVCRGYRRLMLLSAPELCK